MKTPLNQAIESNKSAATVWCISLFFLIFSPLFAFAAPGCTDLNAANYDALADSDDGSCVYAHTFSVDLSDAVVNANGVHIAGDFQGWNPGGTPMVDLGNGVWSYTTNFSAGQVVTYKYVNGNAWGQDESVPASCGADNGFGGFNRQITAAAAPTAVPVQCYAACVACNPVPVAITFQVDLSAQAVNPLGVHLAGSFQGWFPGGTPMLDLGAGLWSYSADLIPGTFIEYKFINGNNWPEAENVPGACSTFGNRFLTVPSAPTVIDVVCFGACEACPPPVVAGCTDVSAINYDAAATEDDGSCQYNLTFTVDMSQQIVDVASVHLVGNFQGFVSDATPLIDLGGGLWSITLPFTAGQVLEYKYINGNVFGQDESVPEACGVDNGFGGFNRSYTTLASNASLATHCYGTCEACPPPVVAGCTDVSAINYDAAATEDDGSCQYNLTFTVDMSQQIVDVASVHLVGNFQGFVSDATPLIDLGGGLWSITLPFTAGQVLEYKYINGNVFGQDESVPEACGVDNGFGGFNRSYTTLASNASLATHCYGFCVPCNQVVINGCTNFLASNYNPQANNENGSCLFEVTFIMNMGSIDISPNGIHIGANFQNFQAGTTPMTAAGSGLFTYTIALPAGYIAQFKYINGNDWSQAESVPFDCGFDDGFNGFQREYTVPAEPSAVPVHCFGSCVDCINCDGIQGCTYVLAVNYNADATIDDGTCLFQGCTDPLAINYSPLYNLNDGLCVYPEQYCGFGTAWDSDLQTCVESPDCQADLNGDGIVNTTDLLLFLSEFGTFCD